MQRLYWLARMLEAGEDPLYVARRVVRMAVEDIGLADPNALSLRWQREKPSISSECPKAISHWRKQSSICALAPKSNALYTAYGAVQRRCRTYGAGSGAAASAQCADQADERRSATARATSTRTTWKRKSPTCNACPTT